MFSALTRRQRTSPQTSRSYGGYSTATHTTYTATRPSSPHYSLPSRRVTDVSAAAQPISPPYSPTRTAPATAPASSSPSAGGALSYETTSQSWAHPAHTSTGGGSVALHQQQQGPTRAQRSRPASSAGMPPGSEGGRPPSRPRSALVSRGGVATAAGTSAGGASTASRGTAARALRALQATASRVASTAGQGPGAGQEREREGSAGGEGAGGSDAAAAGAYAQAMNSVQMLLSRVPGGCGSTVGKAVEVCTIGPLPCAVRGCLDDRLLAAFQCTVV